MSEIRWGSIDVGALAEKFAPAVVADALEDFYSRAVRAEAVVEAARVRAQLSQDNRSTYAPQPTAAEWANADFNLESALALFDAGQEGKPVSPSPGEPTG